jgi:hypothetical protein
MARSSELWVSDELLILLARLTARQAEGVLRIIQAELGGHPLSSLLDCEDQICSSNTYYGTRNRTGWRKKPEFVKALELARRDYRKWLLDHGVEDALTILAATAPDAVRALRQEVAGDASAVEALKRLLKGDDPTIRQAAATQLGKTGLPEVVPALQAALQKETAPEVQGALVAALGRVAGWRDGDRRAAATGILDRADIKTAAKQAFAVEDIDAAIERELARLASGGEAEAAGATEDNTDTGDKAGIGPAGLDP